MKNHRKRGNRSFFFYQRVNDSSQIGFQILLKADVMEGDLSGLIDHVKPGQEVRPADVLLLPLQAFGDRMYFLLIDDVTQFARDCDRSLVFQAIAPQRLLKRFFGQ